MTSNHSFHPFSLIIGMGEEAALPIEISQLVKGVYLCSLARQYVISSS